MRRRPLALCPLLVAALGCGDAVVTAAAPQPLPPAAAPLGADRARAWQAAAYEHDAVELCGLALHRSAAAATRQRAAEMQAAHRALLAALRAQARRHGWRLAPAMSGTGQQLWTALAEHGAATFEPAYGQAHQALRAVAIAHLRALEQDAEAAQLWRWAAESRRVWEAEAAADGPQ